MAKRWQCGEEDPHSVDASRSQALDDHHRRDIQRLLRHTRPETTPANYDICGDAPERHASHQVFGFLAGWAG